MLSLFRSTKAGLYRSRREFLRIGGLSMLGLSAETLARLRQAQAAGPAGERTRRNSCVFLFLFGGPSQIDLWDMKPDAPLEVRGEFRPISTAVPGIQICEHLPRLAREMDKLCLLRSMQHTMNVHGPACSEVFTGREYFGAPTTDQATDLDWPSLSALAMRYAASRPGIPASVILPWYLQFPGQAKRIAGQTGGRMGERHNGLLIQGDSQRGEFRLEGFELHETIPIERLGIRRELLHSLHAARHGETVDTTVVRTFDRQREQAYSMLRERAGEWLDVRREPESLRTQYGSSLVGQSLLMSRRLVEAGVPLVTVNWEDETKIDGVNTCWDTHQDNFPKLKNLLCPLFDQVFPTFLRDLSDRGLLESTLVVAIGEFGRTPHMGQFSQSANTRKTGRDHWPRAFTALLAGGGVRGGQVYGATDKHAGSVVERPVSPADLTATILKHLGVDPTQHYVGEFQEQPHALSIGKPIADLG
jgi:hypothetical protein